MPPTKYKTTGFHLENCLENQGLIYIPQAVDDIKKGDVVSYNTAGFVTNNDLSTTINEFFAGIAAVDSDNSTGNAGTLRLAVIPPQPGYKFWVACGGATVIAATDRGETVILSTNTTLDPTTASTADWGFKIEEIDDSAAALAADTQGFAKGSFVRATT